MDRIPDEDLPDGRKCMHGYRLCQHSKCERDCDDVGCEPTLAHEYHCDCADLGCTSVEPCRGDCGCGGCWTASIDALDGLE